MTSARALLPLLIAVGCATQPPGPWQKPGVDEPTFARDTASCRSAAQAAALRSYPSSGGPAGVGAAGAVAAQQRDTAGRAAVETARFNACMVEKGYHRA
ncbi:MAG: hypothetical protein JSS04_17580 [Proteobacteria bacterium]|nr:hypothetical protein [Pseudomonadota bacterium]